MSTAIITNASPNPLSGMEATVGKDLLSKIHSSKILLVGSGGIGCELLKNLALSGFRHVEVIDLDTIDVSNLNRQFLFRSHHVGQPKCVVACDVASNMMTTTTTTSTSSTESGNGNAEPVLKYKAHHGNVCDATRFSVQYVSGFDLILNALDNVTARRRVNRLALAANVPLVEAGTTGYLGQVKVIHKPSQLACYECVTQETQKVYPICTIRSTPSQPVHCIVWAKELYKLLFGKMEDSMLYEGGGGDEPSTYMEAVEEYRTKFFPQTIKEGAGQDETKENKKTNINLDDLVQVARNLLETLFITEIEKQLDMGKYKTAQKTPTPIAKNIIYDDKNITTTTTTTTSSSASSVVWSPSECVAEFISCLSQAATSSTITTASTTATSNGDNVIMILSEFDKDDDLCMRFVTATANLRQVIFQIDPLQSYHDCKGIAGNIIPAIATTNAIVAGLQVLQAFSILQAQLEDRPNSLKDVCQYVDCVRHKSGRSGLYLLSSTLPNPNPKCFVCRNATLSVTLNVHQWTLQELLDRIMKQELGFEEPSISLEGDIIYEEGQDADTECYTVNLSKSLSALPAGGIVHGTVLRVEDFTQDLEIDICITHQDQWNFEDGEDGTEHKYIIGGDKPTPTAAVAATATAPALPENDNNNDNNNDDDDDEIEIINHDVIEVLDDDDDDDDDDNDKKMASEKRPLESTASAEPVSKKAKL